MKRWSKAAGKTVNARPRKTATLKRRTRPKAAPTSRALTSGEDLETARLVREHDEALEREMATAEVLRVISSSSGQLAPVFQAMLENAVRICDAKFGNLWVREGDKFHIVAMHGAPSEYRKVMFSEPFLQPHSQSAGGRAVSTGQVVQIADIRTAPTYGEKVRTATIALAKARTLVAVPMLKEREAVGIITIYRQEVRPFSDKQIELLKSFAAQAVIAIENARLLSELRQRTADLTESLEQQTATSEVLSVVSGSPGELAPVFQTMLENAVRLCQAKFGFLYLYEGGAFRIVAAHDVPPAFSEARRRALLHPPSAGPLAEMIRTKRTVQVADLAATRVYAERSRPVVDAVELGGIRTQVTVPLLKDNELIGVIGIYRQEVRPFTDKQVALLTNFGSQAVVAIENTRLLRELRQRTDDLTESLEQQTATSEVLKIISSSTGELEPVFQSMLQNAARICEAKFGVLFLVENGLVRPASELNVPPKLRGFFNDRRGAFLPPEGSPLRQTLETKGVVHVADDANSPQPSPAAVLGNARSNITVPMLKDGELIGAIAIFRQEVRPFTHKQIELLKNFAAQAVIAIENARLLGELRQRTADLTESLEQQTATSEVLRVISTSQGELEPVFTAILENATRICRANFGGLFGMDHGRLRVLAEVRLPEKFLEAARSGKHLPGPRNAISRLFETRQAVHVADYRQHQAYLTRDPMAVIGVELAGIRTLLNVPMIKDGELFGFFGIFRQEVEPFTDKQIALVTNFAAQAVIAVENARLLNELRQRTADLSESLEQQTATSEVLRVISSSPSELAPVFDAMLSNATRLCEANFGTLNLFEEGEFPPAAMHNVPAEYAEYRRLNPRFRVVERHALARVAATGQMQQILDMRSEPLYLEKDASYVAMVERAGARTMVLVPMVKDRDVIGVITIFRQEVRPFSDKQIALVQNFAAQAVIAIENARLLNELRQRTNDLSEALDQQTATSEVLGIISRSPGELPSVFEAILTNAKRLCEAQFGILFLSDGDMLRFGAEVGTPVKFAEFQRQRGLFRPRPGTRLEHVMLTKEVIHTENLAATAVPDMAAILGGARSTVWIPMLKDGALIGVICIYRQEIRPFTDKQIELLRNFAAQAVIAIENTRLLNELRQRTDDLSKSLEDLRTAQDRLVQTQKLASLGQLTAGIAHEIKNPLNFVNNFSGVSVELIDELEEALGRVTADGKTRQEIVELADTLRDNLDKIAQHGKRADAIIKNMLLHSREGSGEHRPVDINALVEESLNLAYHGARAEKQGFNIALERSFDPTAGKADVNPQEISRVLINLISNGFYAATKRHKEAKGDGYEPTLTATTKSLGDRVEIRIRDNGVGIPTEVREKMFNPFFTTKPAGEGTGLGLSISYDIIVKQHSGSIEVDTEPGAFTEFRIILPRTAS